MLTFQLVRFVQIVFFDYILYFHLFAHVATNTFFSIFWTKYKEMRFQAQTQYSTLGSMTTLISALTDL